MLNNKSSNFKLTLAPSLHHDGWFAVFNHENEICAYKTREQADLFLKAAKSFFEIAKNNNLKDIADCDLWTSSNPLETYAMMYVSGFCAGMKVMTPI